MEVSFYLGSSSPVYKKDFYRNEDMIHYLNGLMAGLGYSGNVPTCLRIEFIFPATVEEKS